jgi:hypothetical protein
VHFCGCASFEWDSYSTKEEIHAIHHDFMISFPTNSFARLVQMPTT